MTKNLKGLEKYREDRSKVKREKVLLALSDFKRLNKTINFARIASSAGVSRRFLYSCDDLRTLIQAEIPASVERERKKIVSLSASDQSKDHKIKTLTQKCKKLFKENEELRREIRLLQTYIEELSS